MVYEHDQGKMQMKEQQSAELEDYAQLWHMKTNCPTKGKTCFKYAKPNHFAYFCRRRNIGTAVNADDGVNYFLRALCSN